MNVNGEKQVCQETQEKKNMLTRNNAFREMKTDSKTPEV